MTDLEQLLVIIGDLEVARRRLARRVAELERELADRERDEGASG